MARKGNTTYLITSLLLAIALATALEDSKKPATEAKEVDFEYDDNPTDDDGRTLIIPISTTANGGVGIQLGIGDLFGAPGLGNLFGAIDLGNLFNIGAGGLTALQIGLYTLLALGVAAAITLAIVLPIAIGVGIYKKLEEDTGSSGSYGGTSYGSSAPDSYAAPIVQSYGAPAPSYGGYGEQSSYSIHRSLEEAAKKFQDTNE